MAELTLEKQEFEKEISLAEAYLIMFEFLESNWEGCWETELGAILGELSLTQSNSGGKRPMDASVLHTFIEASNKVLTTDNYSSADLKLLK